jgi:hypothetical protein
LAEAERLRQSLPADAGRGDLLKTIIDRVELRPNGLRMILSLVPLTPAAAPPNRLQGIDGEPNLHPAALDLQRKLLGEDAIGSVAELASLEGISDRYEAVASLLSKQR